MATENAKADGPSVKFSAENATDDPESRVELRSPTKNRFTGGSVSPSKTSKRIPILFERSASSWWNLRFDTKILEDQHEESSFPLTRRRFHMALLFIITASTAWCIFFAAMRQTHWIYYVSATIALLAFTILVLFFTFTKYYRAYHLPTSAIVTIAICTVCLLAYATHDSNMDLSTVGIFATSIEILILIYTVIPMPLYLCVIMSVAYSVILEVLSATLTPLNAPKYIIAKFFMHICIHLIGIHINIMSEVRKRSTFLKVGQSVMSRKELSLEKQLTQKMIDSLMPHTVAVEVMKGKDANEDSESRKGSKSPSLPNKDQVIAFRSFHMSQMSNVSILFADIAGFTKMSTNKTADHLVSLLNDLFGRFDDLCTKTGCEKISTLGDCYYCVAGCPEPRDDHAKCCVEMGLGMIRRIKEFDEENNESVNMRVGIHTGTVLCGIVGTKRFKFDVWSNDVTLANTMESEGEPGCVHISNETYNFLKDEYDVRPGKEIKDIRHHKILVEYYNDKTNQYQVQHIQGEGEIQTYFIVGRRQQARTPSPVPPGSHQPSPKPASPDSVQISVDKESSAVPDKEITDGDVEMSTSQPASNHVEGQPVENGTSMTTAALLGRRDNIQVSMENLAVPHTEVEGDRASETSLMQIRKPRHEHTDRQLIECIKEDKGNQDYFYKPPINPCTLNFLERHHENHFREHYLDDSPQSLATFAAPRFSALFDMFVSMAFYVAISVCCFVSLPPILPWHIVFAISMVFELFLMFPLFYEACLHRIMARLQRLGGFFNSWYPRHIFGIVLTSLPAVGVYSNFRCKTFEISENDSYFYCFLVIVSLLHYCNFSMLSSWLKSALATLAGVVLVILLWINICPKKETIQYGASPYGQQNLTSPTNVNYTGERPFAGEGRLKYEMILSMLLLLVLIYFLNRQFETSYRLSFHGDYEAAVDKEKMQMEKERTDWLLHNIVPQHVSVHLRGDAKYSKNHKDVGVIFAKIINFDEFYDESFEGGREYLRVLNEILGDFEDQLKKPEYKDCEKIKTIGSCFMAASGLNPQTRNQNKNPNAHLYALMDFATELLKVLDTFNQEIFNFDFEMSIGFNFGEVTAGVIGTTKLLYDIWGDTVNISSRMYSTGVPGKIQVTEITAKKLEDMFDFEYRGQTNVKGKGIMNTYLLVGKKAQATWE